MCSIAVILSYICKKRQRMKNTHETHAKRMLRRELAPDPILEALTVESFGLTSGDVADNPRIAKQLSE